MGAAFGAVNDYLVSARLSPEYFVLGKGIAEGPGFGGRVAFLGLLAGFGPGALCMCLFLYANSRESKGPSLSFRRLLSLAWMPLAGAMVFGAVIPACFSRTDPLKFQDFAGRIMAAQRVSRFLLVWWIHGGIYLGFIIGTLAGILAIRRERRQASSSNLS
jgi:hypothetical protein